MAPEILLYKDYNKSVDLWSVGILMYMLISGGVHPFYKQGMDVKAYAEILKTSPEITFDESKFSKISIDLIGKMLNFQTIHRYNIDQALKHPWITRCNESGIPITYNDVLKNFEMEDRLRRVIKTLFFCSIAKDKYFKKSEIKPNRKYVKLLNKVTKTIDIWHQNFRKTDFINDEDFIEHQGSPSKFESVSDFSQAFDDYEVTRNGAQMSLSSSPRALSPNQSDREDTSPNSDVSYNIINPIKIESKKYSNRLDPDKTNSNSYFHQETKGSDKTADTIKGTNNDNKNTQRALKSKSLVNKIKSQEAPKKSLPRNKRNKIRSPNKLSRLKVNVPKDNVLSNNMVIKDGLNFSLIDEHVITGKLTDLHNNKDFSRSYMTTSKNKQNDTMMDSFDEDDTTIKNLLSNKHMNNAIALSDYKDHRNL